MQKILYWNLILFIWNSIKPICHPSDCLYTSVWCYIGLLLCIKKSYGTIFPISEVFSYRHFETKDLTTLISLYLWGQYDRREFNCKLPISFQEYFGSLYLACEIFFPSIHHTDKKDRRVFPENLCEWKNLHYYTLLSHQSGSLSKNDLSSRNTKNASHIQSAIE